MSLAARALYPEDLSLPHQSPAAAADSPDAVVVDSSDFAFLNEGGILAAMAKIVMQSVGASGISVAYAREGVVVCRASCGENAPAVGTPLNLNSGIGAQCLREGKTVRCDDTESDPRVNKAVCRRIGVRSILAVPLHLNLRVIGIAQAFYTEPNGFSDANVTELEHSAYLFVSSLPVDDDVKKNQQSFGVSHELAVSALRVPESASQEMPRPTTENAVIVSGDATGSGAEESLLPVLDVISVVPSPDISETIHATPLAEPVLTPDEVDERSGENPRHAQISYAAPAEISSDITLQPFAQIEQPVWWKRPTLAAAVIAGVCALVWVISHPLSQISLYQPPAERAAENSNLISNSQIPYAQLLKKAQSGNTSAQFALAKRFETGAGVRKSLTKAYSWYIISGEGGDEAAKEAIRPLTSKLTATEIAAVRFDVARIYAKGVPTRDYVSAYAWMILAEFAGDARAKAEQRVLAASMRPEQIAAGQRRASNWLKARGYSLQAQASPPPATR